MAEAPSSGSQAMLTMGDDPSCRSCPIVLLQGSPPHSLAIGIARDKSHEYSLSTHKLPLTSKVVLVGMLNSKLFVKRQIYLN